VYASSPQPPAAAADLTVAEVSPLPRIGPARRQLTRGILALWRPGQWPKNLIVVALPLIDLRTWSLAAAGQVGVAVVAFTVASTVVYTVNDIADRERDRSHPTKRLRTVASGQVPVPVAVLCALAQGAVLAGILSTRPPVWCLPIGAYLLLSFAYSLRLKHVPLVDSFAVAAGFVLRLLAGYVAVRTQGSGWLLICVFSSCLLLTLGKRQHELRTFGAAHRPALRGYTVPLTDRLMLLSAVLTAVAYLHYLRTDAPLGGYAAAATLVAAPFALFGLFRYLQLIELDGGGDDPVRLLMRDRPMVVNSLLWLAQAAAFLIAAQHPGIVQAMFIPVR
jgi:4-hydroxybenzoate polyprenyltransferase